MNNIPRTALILVDIQRDFCHGGALAVKNGDEIIGIVNQLIQDALSKGRLVILTKDWHEKEFVPTNPHFNSEKAWPLHCISGTTGAKLHPGLKLPAVTFLVHKGMKSHGYSGFETNDVRVLLRNGSEMFQNLDALLKFWGINKIYVAGLATEYCDKATCLDAIKLGYGVVLIEDACRAVNYVTPDDGKNAIEDMRQAGVKIVTSQEVLND